MITIFRYYGIEKVAQDEYKNVLERYAMLIAVHLLPTLKLEATGYSEMLATLIKLYAITSQKTIIYIVTYVSS